MQRSVSLDFTAEYYASEAEPIWREHSRLSAVIDAVTRVPCGAVCDCAF